MRSPWLDPAARALGVLQSGAAKEDIELFPEQVARMDPLAYSQTLRGLLAAHARDVLPRVKVVGVLEGRLDLARARAAAAAGERSAALVHRASATTRLEAALRPHPGGGVCLANRSDEVRIAIRLLRRAFASGAEPGPGPAAPRAFQIAVGGGWFQPASGARVDLRRHSSTATGATCSIRRWSSSRSAPRRSLQSE